MQYTPYLWPLWISTAILVVLAGYAWLHRERTTARWFFAMLITVFVWVVGFAFEVAAVRLETKLFWANVQFVGIAALPVVWLAMVLDYTGQMYRWKRRIAVLAAVAVLTNLIIWTNPLHHWFRGQPWLNTETPFPVLVNDYNFWFSGGHVLFNLLLFFISFVLLIRSLNFKVGVYRNQTLILIFSALFPLIVDTLYMAGITPIPNFDFTPVVLSFSGLLIGWGLFSFGFLELMPTARSRLIETMADAWLVVDDKCRLVDLNPAAGRLVDAPSKRIVGQDVRRVFQHVPALVDAAGLSVPTSAEIALPSSDGTDQIFELQVVPLPNKWGRLAGRLLTLHNITVRKRAEEEREHLLHELQDALAQVNKLQGLLPICANCKKIRDDQGYWHQVEAYIQDHSEAEFSHGICPDCRAKLYPQFFGGKDE